MCWSSLGKRSTDAVLDEAGDLDFLTLIYLTLILPGSPIKIFFSRETWPR